jgi:hypothetical protein
MVGSPSDIFRADQAKVYDSRKSVWIPDPKTGGETTFQNKCIFIRYIFRAQGLKKKHRIHGVVFNFLALIKLFKSSRLGIKNADIYGEF